MPHKIAEVAVPVSFALNEPFDYSVPESMAETLFVGSRVVVPFRSFLINGYVIRLKNTSPFESKLRPIVKNLDPAPVLNDELLRVAEKIQREYFCSLADAIEVMLPSGVKGVKRALSGPQEGRQPIDIRLEMSPDEISLLAQKELEQPLVLIHDPTDKQRWNVYAALVKKTLNANKSVIFLVPDHRKIDAALARLDLPIRPHLVSSSLKAKESLGYWQAIRRQDFSFVLGTRSAIFSPVNNLGLVIIEEEEHFAYRQDQVPHYRAFQIARWRAQGSKSQVVLGSFMPSLDSYLLSKKTKASYLKLGAQEKTASIRLIDMRHEFRFKGREKNISKIFEHQMAEVLEKKEKLLVFVNKKGFSTLLYCPKCKESQRCPRCSSFLGYHFREKTVSCPTCQYKSEPFEICPLCQSTYVKYFGAGLEKIESELLRLFPPAKIYVYDRQGPPPESYDIMVATQQFLEDPDRGSYSFDTVGVIACEQMLGHPDFRSTERAFSRLLKLSSLAKRQVLIQTHLTENDALFFLQKNDIEGFMKKELQQRRELKLSPVTNMAVLTVRSKNQQKAFQAAAQIYRKLKNLKARKSYQFFDPVPSLPFKLRGNFRYQLLMKYKSLDTIRRTLMSIVRSRKKGAIVTVDPGI